MSKSKNTYCNLEKQRNKNAQIYSLDELQSETQLKGIACLLTKSEQNTYKEGILVRT